MTSTTSSAAMPSTTDMGGGGGGSSSPASSSPLLFFVALGFGVVFTNLWIIVGVKYCFRYNQRNRQARLLGENGEPIDMTQMPQRRRRREKKVMTMEEVNERFPLAKYKHWRSSREAEGLPAEGGVTSGAASIKNDTDALAKIAEGRRSEEAQPETTIELAQQDHMNAAAAGETAPHANAQSSSNNPAASMESVPEKETAVHAADRNASVITEEDEEDDDDPIRTAAAPEMLAAPGDSCAICIDTLEDDDDVRGLTCGHAFHAACVDPWLISRRACCPLCKADYYIPKPRPEGEQLNMPAPPMPIWSIAGGRLGGYTARAHRVPRGPRFFVQDADQMREAHGVPARQNRRERNQNVAAPQEGQEAANPPSTGWRSRLPGLPRFGRNNNQQAADSAPVVPQTENPSPGDLEAGVRR